MIDHQHFTLEHVWNDKEINRLLFSLLVTVGVDPNEIKKYRVFADISTDSIYKQINRLLLQTGSGYLRGHRIDPYRLQKFVNGELLLISKLDKADMWIQPGTGLLNFVPHFPELPNDVEGNLESKRKKTAYRKLRIEFIAKWMKPSDELVQVCQDHLD